jgi:hypothetical protein
VFPDGGPASEVLGSHHVIRVTLTSAVCGFCAIRPANGRIISPGVSKIRDRMATRYCNLTGAAVKYFAFHLPTTLSVHDGTFFIAHPGIPDRPRGQIRDSLKQTCWRQIPRRGPRLTYTFDYANLVIRAHLFNLNRLPSAMVKMPTPLGRVLIGPLAMLKDVWVCNVEGKVSRKTSAQHMVRSGTMASRTSRQ